RTTTTRRLRPRPHQPTPSHLRRRTHRQPRLPLRRRSPHLPAQQRPDLRPNHRHGHPRPRRRLLRQPRHLPRRRPDRRRTHRPHPRHRPGHHEAPGHHLDAGNGDGVMLRATLKGMLSRKLRLLLSGLAVVLGVMFVSGALVLTDTLGRSFDQLFAGVYAHTDVQVHGEPRVAVSEFEGEVVPANLPADTVERVAAVPGVASARGLVEADGARLIGPDGKVVTSFGPPRLGINWTGEDKLVQLREGRGPAAPDEIAIDAALAETAGVSLGDRVGVLTLEPRQDFTVVGIFGFGERDSLGGVQFVAFTDEVAQRLMLGEPDVWTAVDVRAAEGVSPEQLRDDIAAVLGDGYQVRTGAELAEEQSASLKEGLRFFSYILLGFAGVALFVGVFLIINTFSIIIAQQTRELSLIQIGRASCRQVLGSVLFEATVIGLVASVLGLAAGYGVG